MVNHNYRVMIVDDNEAILVCLSALLKERGINVIEYTDPELALLHLKQYSIDCIISDYHMLHMNGIDFLNSAKVLHPHCITILISGTFYTIQNNIETHIFLAKEYGFMDKLVELICKKANGEGREINKEL